MKDPFYTGRLQAVLLAIALPISILNLSRRDTA